MNKSSAGCCQIRKLFFLSRKLFWVKRYVGEKEIIGDAEPTINLLDENINWASVQHFFTTAAWGKVSDMIPELEKNSQWKCGACHKDLSTAASIICESCLVW